MEFKKEQLDPAANKPPECIIQIIPAGCNRECFALTTFGNLYLLEYRHGFRWIKMPSIPE